MVVCTVSGGKTRCQEVIQLPVCVKNLMVFPTSVLILNSREIKNREYCEVRDCSRIEWYTNQAQRIIIQRVTKRILFFRRIDLILMPSYMFLLDERAIMDFDKLFMSCAYSTANVTDCKKLIRTYYGMPGNGPFEDTNSSSESRPSKKLPVTLNLWKTTRGSSLDSIKQILVIDADHDTGLAIKARLETYRRKEAGCFAGNNLL